MKQKVLLKSSIKKFKKCNLQRMEDIISAQKLSKTYGNLQVLKEVDLSIRKGEIIAIVGPSGAGKTTLLQLLGTLSTPDKNTKSAIRILDKDIIHLSPKALANFRNKHMGFIFQFHELLDEFSALENIIMPALIGGKNKKNAEERGLELLHLLGIKERKNHRPNALSGGEQQRVAIARALMNSPAIIFADEPSGNLDSKNAETLHHLFFELRDKLGQTFVIVTHNKELAQMADRIIELKDGRVIS